MRVRISKIRKNVCECSKFGEHWSNGNYWALCILHGQLEFHLPGESSLTLQLVVVQVEV